MTAGPQHGETGEEFPLVGRAAALEELWPHDLAPATDADGVRVSVHHTQGEDL